MLTRVSHTHANQACQSQESSLRLRLRWGRKKTAAQWMVLQPGKPLHHTTKRLWQVIAKDKRESLRLKYTNKNTTNAQLIEMFCSKNCRRSFSDSLSSEFKNMEEKKKRKSTTEHERTQQSRERNERGRTEEI